MQQSLVFRTILKSLSFKRLVLCTCEYYFLDSFAILQAVITTGYLHLKMPASKDPLVFAALFVIFGVTQCQKLPSKLLFFVFFSLIFSKNSKDKQRHIGTKYTNIQHSINVLL